MSAFRMLQKRHGRIRNAMICHLAVVIVPSMPCSAITAAVCRPRPSATECDTSAVAMMLRAWSIKSAVQYRLPCIEFTYQRKENENIIPTRLFDYLYPSKDLERGRRNRDTRAYPPNDIDLCCATLTEIHICVEARHSYGRGGSRPKLKTPI